MLPEAEGHTRAGLARSPAAGTSAAVTHPTFLLPGNGDSLVLPLRNQLSLQIVTRLVIILQISDRKDIQKLHDVLRSAAMLTQQMRRGGR